MSCMDPHDQFYALPNRYKTARKARSPDSLHIESVDELENASAALVVSAGLTRIRRSSLAKPREDNAPRTSKSVSFSKHVSIRTIPARKVPTSTGLDLYDIMAATDGEFAFFLGGNFPKASWRPRDIALTAHPASPKPSLRLLSSTRPAHAESTRSCRYSSCSERALGVRPSISTWRDHTSTTYSTSLRRIRAGLVHMQPTGPSAQHIGDRPTTVSTIPAVRTRQASLRHRRQMRLRDAAGTHNTPLRRRQVQRHGLPVCQRPKRQLSLTQHRVDSDHHTGAMASISRLNGSSRSLSSRQEQFKMPQYTSEFDNTRLPRYVPQQVRTYVDHIREQRSPSRPVQAHFVPEPIRKVLSAVSN